MPRKTRFIPDCDTLFDAPAPGPRGKKDNQAGLAYLLSQLNLDQQTAREAQRIAAADARHAAQKRKANLCANKEQAERRLNFRANRKCEACGKVFTPMRSTGRFCSARCRVASHRAGGSR